MSTPAKIYNFHDEWEVKAPFDKAWEAISDSAHWQRWWPGLKSAVVIQQSPGIIGSCVELTWRSKTGYRLKHSVAITEITPGKSIEFTSDGDLKGYGTWKFKKQGLVTGMFIDWHVETSKNWMNILSPILRPVFNYNHAALMKSGERGLNQYLMHS